MGSFPPHEIGLYQEVPDVLVFELISLEVICKKQKGGPHQPPPQKLSPQVGLFFFLSGD